ncbi:MAG: PEP-CTERM sorting domain-containing protein [Rubrivivax sp.]|nr:MAG: PEP-CTERM sorting domain-containing protein [Rubrivivax sp.]
MTYNNFDSHAKSIEFTVITNADIRVNSVVPEPSSYALLLGGGLMAAGLKRRRQQEQA